MQLPTGSRTVFRLLCAVALVYLLGYAFRLLNVSSDFGVAAGIAIIAIEVAFVSWWASRMNRKYQIVARVTKWLSLSFLAFALTGCYTVVQPGHAGIVVNQSGGDRGVSQFPVVTGRVFYNPFNTTVLEYPTFVQTAVWTASAGEGHPANEEISFNSKEGIVFKVDVSLSYQIDQAKVPSFYVKFRTDDIDKFTHGYLRNIARDALVELGPQYTTEEIYGPKMGELMTKAKAQINTAVDTVGVKVEQFGFIGAPRPPDNIIAALNGKVQAIQDAQKAVNRLQQIQAEANMAVAKAGGEAKANQVLTSSLSTSLLEWRRLQIQEQTTARWDGKLPAFVSGGNGVTPLIQFPSKQP